MRNQPLTDEILPEGDSCKQERISKCLAYVASLLQQQLNHDHVAPMPSEKIQGEKRQVKKAKPAMQDLAIDAETLKGYRFFDYPVSISRVVRNVNELLPKNMNHLLYADVANFLVQEGILERQSTENGTDANLPTAKGETYGFEGKTVIFFATSGGSSIDKANQDFKAQYPKIDWKSGKTLNGASKAEIKAWVDGLK